MSNSDEAYIALTLNRISLKFNLVSYTYKFSLHSLKIGEDCTNRKYLQNLN
jgi:hypothetical protein